METYNDNFVYKEVSPQGDVFYFDYYYELHRLDGPAVELENGDVGYYIHGAKHREDGPAVILANGTKYWYTDGKLHREDGPAVEHRNGTKMWYERGRIKHVEF